MVTHIVFLAKTLSIPIVFPLPKKSFRLFGNPNVEVVFAKSKQRRGFLNGNRAVNRWLRYLIILFQLTFVTLLLAVDLPFCVSILTDIAYSYKIKEKQDGYFCETKGIARIAHGQNDAIWTKRI